MWIEIFKTGSHTDFSGSKESYDTSKLDYMAQTYNTRLAQDASQEAPLVKGHPKTEDPAYGWIEKLARKGDRLFAKIRNLAPQIIDEIKQGMYKKVSIALYPDLMLRHIGLLGAVQPAVKGLKPVAFADDSEFLTYEFSEYLFSIDNKTNEQEQKKTEEDNTEAKNNETIEQLQARIIALENENQMLREKISIAEKESRLKEYREFANSLIDSPDGTLIAPAQADCLVDLLEMAFNVDNGRSHAGEYSENIELLPRLKNFALSLKPKFDTREYASNSNHNLQFSENDFKNKNVSPDRMKLHLQALEYRRQNPDLSYEEAVCQAQKANLSIV